MTALLHGELIKATTTRTMLAYGLSAVGLAIVAVLILTLSGDVTSIDQKQAAIAGGPVVLLLFGIVGGAGEYRHRTAAPAVLVAPGAGRLLGARMAAYGLAGLAVAAGMVAVTLAVGLPLLAGEPGPALGTGDVVVVAAGSLAAAGLSTMMGAAVGTILRNQVAGVVGALVLAFIVEPLIPSISERAADFMPVSAAGAVAGQTNSGGLTTGWALLVVVAWTVVLVAAAIVIDRRRDVA